MPAQPAPPRSFESALSEFEALVEKLERGDLSLEDSVDAYERGVVLHRYCEQALSTAERKIRILTEGAAGGEADEELRSFEVESFASRPRGPASAEPDAGMPAAGDPNEDEIPF